MFPNHLCQVFLNSDGGTDELLWNNGQLKLLMPYYSPETPDSNHCLCYHGNNSSAVVVTKVTIFLQLLLLLR
jgi:hypothetical protein